MIESKSFDDGSDFLITATSKEKEDGENKRSQFMVNHRLRKFYYLPDSNAVHMLTRDSDASARALPPNAQSTPPYPDEQAHLVVHNGLVTRHSSRRLPEVSRYSQTP